MADLFYLHCESHLRITECGRDVTSPSHGPQASYTTTPSTTHLIQGVSCIVEEDAAAMDLTDEQWTVLNPLIGELPPRACGRGRPQRDCREVVTRV